MQEIYKKIIPNYLYPVNVKTIGVSIFHKSVQQFLEVLQQKYGVHNDTQIFVMQFLEQIGTKYLSALFLQKLNFDCCFTLIDEIIRSDNKYYKLVQCLLSLIYIHKDVIKEINEEEMNIEKYILDNTQKALLVDAMKI